MKPRTLVIVLAALSMIGALSIDAYLPALPAIAHRFGMSLAVAQQSLTVYLLAFAAMVLFYGTLSDSFGRRRVILVALSIYLFGSIGAGLAPNFGALMFFRLLQGLSAGAGSVVGRAMIADRFKGAEAERMMSYVNMVFTLAPAIAPIMGGWLQVWFGWRSIFLFIALFAVTLLAICARGLEETLPVEERHPFQFTLIVKHYWRAACHGRFILQLLASAFIFSTLMLYVGSAPAVIFNILHLKATDFSWVFIPLVTGMLLGSMYAGRLSHRPGGGAKAIRYAYVVVIVSALAHILFNWQMPGRLPWAVLPVGTSAFGASLAGPAMVMRSMAIFPEVRGLTSSLQGFCFMLIFSLGSGFIAPLLFDSGLKLALGSAVGILVSLLCWIIGTSGEPNEVTITPPAAEMVLPLESGQDL